MGLFGWQKPKVSERRQKAGGWAVVTPFNILACSVGVDGGAALLESDGRDARGDEDC